ncbi:uncharacterized protein LOC142239983 [Haematobia irritans]|uniref:uncharacterized protein LOC142239983 n=1 Tax=Haematobia irritans TaxID=7368 RepID=UPI003F4F5536
MCAFIVKNEAGKRQIEISFHNVDCNTSYPDLLKPPSCSFNKLAINRYSFSVCFELIRQLERNADAWVRIYYNIARSHRIVKLIDFRLKICDALHFISRVPLIQFILIELRRNSNLPISCPLKENNLYNISNMIITDAVVPIYAGNMDFNFTIDFFEMQKKLIASYRVLGSIGSKNRNRG